MSSTAAHRSGEHAPSAAADEASTAATHRPESCVQYFDALWFCYSPVHQMEQYYRFGIFDDCKGHWGRFMGCMARKTRLGSPAEPPVDHSFWKQRDPAEAAKFWKSQFPDCDAAPPPSS
mmetsp:Transcript_42036/g.106433  ORF Transcript_42036/g.106433 Transcript_42036/m.106433 type:complete len:119 (+) Transcript_42036:116-472(+)|eukprot:jgi/Tetstr1/466329/TSEL_010860.t1